MHQKLAIIARATNRASPLGQSLRRRSRIHAAFHLAGSASSPNDRSMNEAQTETRDWDVVVIGGALAGASTALILRRSRPGLRVLVLEKSTRFTRRVGEATVEISGFFLGRVLGLTRHLNEHHLVKQGMRFWFENKRTANLDDCSEIGARYQARLPAYQLDRAVLDEEVLANAVTAGVEVLRGAKVRAVRLKAGAEQEVDFEQGSMLRTVRARWVVDASGFTALLSRQEGWLRPNAAHPTCAVWARWRGVGDLDGLDLAGKYPEWAAVSYGIRSTATNHLMGDGWWAWLIPLKGGDTSVGLVYDQRHVRFPKEGPLGERLKQFLCRHPVGRELLAGANCVEHDVLARSNLPFSSDRYFGDGFALVGDAGAFLDPFYSPGMDWLSFTVTAATQLILKERGGESPAPQIERFNRDFTRAYDRWFTAIYHDKYDYLGDYELMRTVFQLDLGLYYLGIVSQPFKRGAAALSEPVFCTPPSVPVFHLIRTYNRRMAAIARSRRARGTFGRSNHGERFLMGGFTLEPSSGLGVLKAMAGWFRLELTEGWRTWGRTGRRSAKSPSITPVPSTIPGSPAQLPLEP
jgi:flavin-dependent dehydrogenase